MQLGRRGTIWLAGAGAVLVLLLTVVIFRAPIAEAVGTRVLAWRGIEASFDITRLGLGRAVVERLAVGSADRPAIAARRIEARYGFFGLLGGRIDEVAVDGLEIRATIDAEGARIEGLPTGRGGGGSGRPARVPRVSIPDGRVFVTTPAGELVADVSVAGGPDEGWMAQLSAHPASLVRGADALELSAAMLEASVADQALTVSGDVRLAALSHAGVTARDATAEVAFAGTYEDASRLAGLAGDGTARLAIASVQLDGPTAAAYAERMAPELKEAMHEALGAHMDALRGALVAALSDLAVDAELAIGFADGSATIAPVGDATVTAASGARVAVAGMSDAGGVVVFDAGNRVTRARNLTVMAQVPEQLDVRAIVAEASLRRGRAGVVGDVIATAALAPWTAGELTLAADIQRANVGFGGGPWRAETQAEVRATGARFNVTAHDAVARLDLEIVREGDGFAVRARGDARQPVSAAGIGVAGRLFEEASADVIPFAPGTPLMRTDADGVVIASRLQDLSAGTEALGGRWALLLPATELTMRSDPDGTRGVNIYVQAPRFEGRLDGGDAVLQASVVEGRYGLVPSSARLRFEGLSLGGSALPARIARAAGELNATLVDGRPDEGRVTLTGIEVVDTAELARIVPLTITGDAPIAGGVLAGVLTATNGAGRTILRADVNHDFPSGHGAMTLATPRFTFEPEDGLQPGDISPTLEPYVNVTGSAGFELRTAWGDRGATASAAATLDRLSFDWRFGHVGGVTTRFEVADLLHMRTAAPQRIDIALIDPGLPLENGAVEIELLGPTRLRLASARFPFAGGLLTAAPAEIDLTSERKLVLLLAEHVSLERLHAMFNPPNLVLTGALTGRIPLEARDRSVYVVDGELVSDGPGRVAYTGRAGEGIAQQNESTKLAFDALANFSYQRLTLTLDGDVAGRLQANVRLEGHNPQVLEGYPINFNLNTSAEFVNLLTDAFRGLDLSAAARGAEIENEP